MVYFREASPDIRPKQAKVPGLSFYLQRTQAENDIAQGEQIIAVVREKSRDRPHYHFGVGDTRRCYALDPGPGASVTIIHEGEVVHAGHLD